jgi:tetratricopeptide (TPR) repeat protein
VRDWVLGRYRDYARACLLAAVVATPIVFWRGGTDVFNLVKITVLWVLGVSAIALWAMWAAERGVWIPRVRMIWPAAAFLASLGVSAALSISPLTSLFGQYQRYGGLLSYLLYAGVAVTVVGLWWEKPQEISVVARASALAATVVAIHVLIQAAGLDWISWKDLSGNEPRNPGGALGNSNFTGAYLALALPYLGYSAIRSGILGRAVLAGAASLSVAALWYTQTRGGMIAAVAGIGGMVFASGVRLPRWAKASALAALTVAVLVAILVIWHPGLEEPPGILGRARTFRTDTLGVRVWYWTAATRAFADRPLVGNGPDTFYATYPPNRASDDGADLGLDLTDKPHSLLFEHAAGVGAVGTGAFLVLVGTALWLGLRRRGRVHEHDPLLLGAFAGSLVAYLAQGVLSIDVPPLALAGWVALGGIAVLADPVAAVTRAARVPARRGRRSASPAPAYAPNRAGPARWAFHLPVASVGLILLIVGAFPLAADVQHKSATLKTPPVREKLEAAAALNPIQSFYRAWLGESEEYAGTNARTVDARLDGFHRAIRHYESALALQPANIFYLLELAHFHGLLGASVDPDAFEDSEIWYRRALEHDPTDWEVHFLYASMLDVWAEREDERSPPKAERLRGKAIRELSLVVRMRPDEVDALLLLAEMHLALDERAEARDALEKVLEMDPDNRRASNLLEKMGEN